jgi:hypothetical protein
MVQAQSQKWADFLSTLKTNICTPKSRTNCHNVTVKPTATFAHINCDSWSNVFLIHVVPAMAARGVPSMDQPVCDDNCPPELVGPGLGSRFKYNWFLGAGKQWERTHVIHKKSKLHQWRPALGLKRNPIRDTVETNKKMTRHRNRNGWHQLKNSQKCTWKHLNWRC